MKKKITQQKLSEIHDSLKSLINLGLPCSYALAKNAAKLEVKNKKYMDALREARDKMCVLDSDHELGYKIKQSAQRKRISKILMADFDAGKNQKKYEEELKKISEKIIEVDFYTINLNRNVTNKKGDEVRLGDRLEYEYDIPALLMVNLVDTVFVEE